MSTVSSYYQMERTTEERTGFPPATVAEKATAALAGWRVVLFDKRASRGWQTLDPRGTEMCRYECEDDGWAAAWALCQARAEVDHKRVGYEPKGSWWKGGWATFRAQQKEQR